MRSASARFRSATRPAGSRNHHRRRDRFLFTQPSIESFLGGVRRAFSIYVSSDRLDAMRRSAMSRSFSWNLSAALYSALYRQDGAP